MIRLNNYLSTSIECPSLKKTTYKTQKSLESLYRSSLKITQVAFSILFEIALLPLAATTLFIYVTGKINLNPTKIKTNKVPILLLHSSGYNETEWIVGRLFFQTILGRIFRKQEYGSVFSLNYDGLVSNHKEKGIDDYAEDKVRKKIDEIKKLTNQNEVIIIGHSMGALIGGYYAENLAKQDGTIIQHIISVASPWQGSPLIEKVKKNPTKRHTQMSVGNEFIQDLTEKALQSEKKGIRKYYNIGSSADPVAPSPYSNLTTEKTRQYNVSYLGHTGLVVFPTTWKRICLWLDAAYAN